MKLRFYKIGSLREDNEQGIIVGPMILLPSHDKVDRKLPDSKYRGPFESQRSWLLAVAKGQLDLGRERPFLGEDLQKMQDIIQDIEESILIVDHASHCKIGLEHVDLNLTNVLVDPDFPTEITGVIDWEGARTAPMWAIQPHFFDRTRKMMEVDKQELHAFAYELVRHRVSGWNAGGREPGVALRTLLRRAQERHEHDSALEDAILSLTKMSLQLDEERLRRKVAVREESPDATTPRSIPTRRARDDRDSELPH
ncbi:hypothetical protein NEOLEDRAFT_1136179 [Neolentinus lepideus HHB14362 ss-1]|uniref:Aminoglycoside phosphotransferase domain-containing protein n=1 Tax=Neolentinus lepideus HHB14362 ss-1 TaxID=1314782 RepID=A0A165REA5_9AGAM|nr:hypothetical protein NEOLEDRAFT_1136179 [Neolentinus lepideus HHB14362 ss-1]